MILGKLVVDLIFKSLLKIGSLDSEFLVNVPRTLIVPVCVLHKSWDGD